MILFSIPAILSAYQLHGLLEPMQTITLAAARHPAEHRRAAIIGFVGWLLAKGAAGLVPTSWRPPARTSLAEGGLADTVKLSRVVGTIVYILVFVPSLIAALDALQIAAISKPATDMLDASWRRCRESSQRR